MKKKINLKNVLCIRTDNMGDLLMSIPALRALKETFGCKITVLLSPATKEIARQVDCIDQTIPFRAPWNRKRTGAEEVAKIIGLLRDSQFDAAVIFTVYSQNPLPAALLALMANIPIRLAYCRENPYQLLTHWVPDKEPYFTIQHQVVRDLKLVKTIGATVSDDRIHLQYPSTAWQAAREKIYAAGGKPEKPWCILHAGVSENKRAYPTKEWKKVGKKLIERFNLQLFCTGNEKQREEINKIVKEIGCGAIALAGRLNISELIALIDHAPFIISVNTVVIHIAAARETPLIVLYALTNPQHTPWKVPCKIFSFHPPAEIQSKNEIVRFVYEMFLKEMPDDSSPNNIVEAVSELYINRVASPVNDYPIKNWRTL